MASEFVVLSDKLIVALQGAHSCGSQNHMQL